MSEENKEKPIKQEETKNQRGKERYIPLDLDKILDNIKEAEEQKKMYEEYFIKEQLLKREQEIKEIENKRKAEERERERKEKAENFKKKIEEIENNRIKRINNRKNEMEVMKTRFKYINR